MKIIKLFALIVTLAFLFACSSGGGSSSNGSGPGPSPSPSPGPAPAPGPAPVSAATFISNGGNATDATSGNGGSINIGGNNGEFYGDVSVTTGGSVDTSFTVPTYAVNYGTNKLTISADTVVKLSTDTINVGDYYLYTDDQNLYYMDVATETVVTGLEVQAGVTMTLPVNYPGSISVARISLNQTVTINGTIKPADDGVSLGIHSGSLLQIGATGLVTTKPLTAGIGAAATAGGNIYLYGEVAINRGTINASGSATTGEQDGGKSGGVLFEADSFLYNTGIINAQGGTSTYVRGGRGSKVELNAYYASLFNSGTINTSGGSGATTGGRGGEINLNGGSQGAAGSLIVSGSLLNNGGTGGTGSGGAGGDINFDNNGGKLWSNATINTKGGSSTAAAGGYGGSFDLYADYGSDYGYGNAVETKGIKLSGTINLSGGNGATGAGNGGGLSLENYYSEYGLLPTPAVEMVGFTSFNMDGGAGFTGGQGGSYQIRTNAYFANGIDQLVGSIINQVPVSAKGGAGSMINPGQGGAGGTIYFDYNGEFSLATTTTSNSGAIDISGGAGDIGGDAGWVYMYGYGKLTNSGAITARGGVGTTSGGIGSGPNSIDFYSSYDIENTGAIDASGASGVTGGGGGRVSMYAGGQTRNSAAITGAGGAGTTTGGNGGQIDLYSEMLPTSNSGILSVPKGTGGTSAIDGWIWIDWVDVGPVHTSSD